MYNGSDNSSQYLGNPLTAAPEDTLVAAAKGGGHQAYVELCRRHRRLVFQIVQRITKNEGDTEDILQDSWMKAFIHIKSFNGRSRFSTWVTRIAINSALMMLRKRRGRIETSLDDHLGSDDGWFLDIEEPSHNPEEQCLRRERQRLVSEAVGHLPPSLRTVIELQQAQDLRLREIANTVGISVPATKARLQRAKAILREPLRGI